jgi:hypothetical protein
MVEFKIKLTRDSGKSTNKGRCCFKGLKVVFRAGSMAQVVEHLPGKCKALSSNSSIANKTQNNNKTQKQSSKGLIVG